MTIASITPSQAKRRLDSGTAVLVDIREPMEHAREAIPGAKPAPLSAFDPALFRGFAGPDAPALIFHCQGGRRTAEHAERLAACGAGEIYLLQGGLSAWKGAGFETRSKAASPIDVMRQMQIVAGTLILLGVFLSLTLSPWFAALAVLAGMGQLISGLFGWCGMVELLNRMPWNRLPAA
jgi:rhodanese-related sulfurtransferase